MGWCNIVFLVRLVLGCLGFKFRFCGLTMLVRWLGLDCCLSCWVGLMFGLLCLLVVLVFRFGVWVLFVVFGVSVLCVALGRGGSFWVFPGYFFSVVWVDVDFLFWCVVAVGFWVCP